MMRSVLVIRPRRTITGYRIYLAGPTRTTRTVPAGRPPGRATRSPQLLRP